MNPDQRIRACWDEIAHMPEHKQSYFATGILVELEALAGRTESPIQPEDLVLAVETSLAFSRTALPQDTQIICAAKGSIAP